MDEQVQLDAVTLRAVADGLSVSAGVVHEAAGALGARGLDQLARRVRAWSAVTADDARRLTDTVERYVRQDADLALAIDSSHR
ncbi:hypothetical protein [Rhodococcus kronopolitis]|uniref:Uncharacterized protein n=1 Tax=Rhodococcus kronopolitis TaxID=1460226 RepID=A0ABV9FNS8_9NOCA